MKGYLSIFTILFLCSCAAVDDAEVRFQNDADLIRLEHLVYWTGLIEEYESRQGTYPFQNELDSSQSIGLVNIATKQQARSIGIVSGRYTMKTIAELVEELESVLGRAIDEM